MYVVVWCDTVGLTGRRKDVSVCSAGAHHSIECIVIDRRDHHYPGAVVCRQCHNYYLQLTPYIHPPIHH